MSVRAKFRCSKIEGEFVVFNAVIADSEDNKSWSKWTPSGQLSMNITNPDAINQFSEGQDYYLDISPVKVVAADSGGSNPPGGGQPGKP